MTMTREEDAAFRAAMGDKDPQPVIAIDAIDVFAAVEEPGAEALLGDADNALIPEGGDIMVYGDGGAGKTTLVIDAALHLGAGADWLGIPVQRVARVLVIENEGPRALLRRKLRRRLAAWDGSSAVHIWSQPWGRFTFASEEWRDALARQVEQHEIDIVVCGPLTRIGMDAAGTLQEIVEFTRLLADVRGRCSRSLTVILIHHEGKSGSVSGAWEGAGDTLLHVKAAGPGHTICTVQKARWASEYHGQTLKLEWTDGGGFAREVERDLAAEILELLSDETWHTVEQIRDEVKAGTKAVRDVVENDERFDMVTGEAARRLGRNPRSKLYGVRA